MELIDRVKEILSREYGIESEADLMNALEAQQPLDIGIFVSACGREQNCVQTVS